MILWKIFDSPKFVSNFLLKFFFGVILNIQLWKKYECRELSLFFLMDQSEFSLLIHAAIAKFLKHGTQNCKFYFFCREAPDEKFYECRELSLFFLIGQSKFSLLIYATIAKFLKHGTRNHKFYFFCLEAPDEKFLT